MGRKINYLRKKKIDAVNLRKDQKEFGKKENNIKNITKT